MFSPQETSTPVCLLNIPAAVFTFTYFNAHFVLEKLYEMTKFGNSISHSLDELFLPKWMMETPLPNKF